MNEIDLFNQVARLARPAFRDYVPIETLDMPFPETGLDSLDGVMISIYLCEIYDIEEEVAKEFSFTTPAELFELCHKHKKKTPESVEAAMEMIK